jgi:hypothetical protein
MKTGARCRHRHHLLLLLLLLLRHTAVACFTQPHTHNTRDTTHDDE